LFERGTIKNGHGKTSSVAYRWAPAALSQRPAIDVSGI
jgi:hypothetical protein